MILRIDETFRLPRAEVSSFFRSPSDWPRLYGRAGPVRSLGDGWFAVPLKGSPWPLVARCSVQPPSDCVEWELRGFWKGRGGLRFEGDERQVRVTGFEEISVRWLGPLSILVEKALMERRFRAIWELGWRRLRSREGSRDVGGRGP